MDASGPDGARRAQGWIDALGLQVLPGESGWWAPVERSALLVEHAGEQLAASSSIYYLLDARRPVNVWHWLAGDDTHVLINGGPVQYVLLPDGRPARRQVLGRDTTAGQTPVVTAPGGCWKALRLLDPDGFALMATVVTPAWTPQRVRIGLPAPEAAAWSASAAWLTPDLIARLGDASPA